MQIKKKITLKTIFQVIILLLVSYFFYLQLSKLNINSLKKVQIEKPFLLLLALSFVFLNWYFEFLKWKKIISQLKNKTSNKILIYSFFAGILSGFLSPNLLGNFIGRMYYFERKFRPSIITFSLLSNFTQFFASIFFGILALFFISFPFEISETNLILLKIIFILFILVSLVTFFFIEKVYFKKIQDRKWFQRFKAKLVKSSYLRLELLFLSLIRHFVFSLQFVFVFCSFGFNFSLELIFIVWGIYFWSTLIPSLWFGKLLIREGVAIWLFSFYGFPPEIALLSSVFLWVINQGLTALISIPFFKFSANV